MPRPSTGRLLAWLGVGLVLVVAGLIAIVFFAQSTLSVTGPPEPEALRELDAIRTRFAGTPPCLERSDGFVTSAGPAPVRVGMLAWNRTNQRLVRASTPYWALRAGSWKVNAASTVAPALEHVSLADLDRCGRGLILDRATAGGGRVIIWAE